MSQFFLPILIGFVLLAMLFYWVLRGNSGSASRIGISEAHQALALLQVKLLPLGLADRILDTADADFARSQSNPAILELLEKERKALAIFWLHYTREQVGLLMSFHVRSARRSANLSPSLEFKLALNYLNFLTAYRILLGLFWTSGPFSARRVSGIITGAAVRLCQASEQVFATMEPAELTAARIPTENSTFAG
jgi:hypothetical protein